MIARVPLFLASSRGSVLGLAVLVALFVLHAAAYWDWVEDDAYITLRYAANLVAGHGPVFNPGERVEGYSNPGWMLVAALALGAGADPLVVLRLLGLLAGAGCVVLSWHLARRLDPQAGAWALLAPLWLAATPMLPRHAVSGLETDAYALALLAGVLLVVAPRGRPRPVAALGALLALMLLRPEGVAFAALLLLLGGHRGGARRGLWLALATALVLLTAWRWGYYGALLPNTFHVKITGAEPSLRAGFHHLREFLRDGGGAALLGLGVVLLADRAAAPRIAAVLVIAAAQGALVIAAGGDWMHHHRFLVPVLPLLVAAMAAGAARLVASLGSAWGGTRVPILMVAILVLTGLSASYLAERAVWREVMPSVRAGRYLPQSYARVAAWLRAHTAPDALVAISDVGAVGYHSGRPILDMLGLVDAHIARSPGGLHAKHDVDYVLSRRPDYVVLVETGGAAGRVNHWRGPDRALAASAEFSARYRPVASVPMGYREEVARIYALRPAER